MQKTVIINLENLPHNMLLATSYDLQGLVVQGQTISEFISISSDVSVKLL